MSLSRLLIRHFCDQIRLYADTQHLQDQIITAQKQLQQVNKIYVIYYNQCWTDITFKKDDLMLINERNISVNKQIKKLHWKKLSSFKIQCVINQLLYELNLSENCNIYNMFNVTLLKLFWDTHHMFSMLAKKNLLLNQDNEWEVKAIMNSWIYNSRLQYKDKDVKIFMLRTLTNQNLSIQYSVSVTKRPFICMKTSSAVFKIVFYNRDMTEWL